MKKTKLWMLAVMTTLCLGMSLEAYAAIGPGEGMGSQGGTTTSSTEDDNPWTGYTNQDGSAFSYLERGISVSKFQNEKGSIDWAKAKADGLDFAIVRISYGLTEDAYFDQNVTGAQNAGIKVGAYVCATAKNMTETIAEANLAISKLQKYNLAYPVAYDMEVNSMLSEGATAADLTAMANKFCEMVAAAGYTPVVYANANWLTNYLNVADIPYDVWYAAYPADKVYRPVSGTRTTIWQTGDNGRVDGIVGNVTTEFSMKAYGGGSPSTKYATTVSIGSGSSGVIYAGGAQAPSTSGPSASGSGSTGTAESAGTSAVNDGWSENGDGSWYYYESGTKAIGWRQIGGYWYYFDASGTMVHGWVEDQGNWYYMSQTYGDMKTGWRFVNDLWYYMEEDGVMLRSTTREINGVSYTFDDTGACINP